MLVANPKLEANNVAGLIALAKSKPGALNYGSTGVGNPLHLTMEMLKSTAGIDIQAVHYRGDAPANIALIAGEIQLGVMPMATTLPLVKDGKIKALAIGGAQRSAAAPNIPTVAETIPGFESTSWQGYFVPAGTPREIVLKLQQETAKVLKLPEVVERLRVGGNEGVGSTPEEFDTRFRADIVKFAKIIADAKIPKQD
jgi:tripartite-type tricarboxylate transporter receptor subunit TctC